MRRRNVDNETEANLYAQLRITNAAGANVEENLSNTNLDQPLFLLLRSALFPLMQMDGQSLNGVPRPRPESGRKDAGRGGGGGGNRKVHLTDRMPARPPNENEALL